jgi:hypothetical protein
MWVPAMGAQGGFASRGEWMTPNVPNGGRHVPPELVASKGMTADGQKRTVGLESQSKYWSTPDCNTATYSNGKFGPNLREQSTQWPTPAAQQYGGTAEQHLARKSKMAGGPRTTVTELNAFIQQWPTPAARDFRSEKGGVKTMEHFNRPSGPSLGAFIEHSDSSLPALQTPDGQESSNSSPKSPRHLNPLFGAWLMGWPSTWVIAEPHASSALETELFRLTLQSHLSSLLGEQDSHKAAA